MSLPFLLVLSLQIFAQYADPLESISHYYFTRVSAVFIGIMSILAVFLIIYKGKEPIDFYVSLTAGIAALGVILFPTSNISVKSDEIKEIAVTVLKPNELQETFHYISAAIFLLCLTYMSLCLFTKSDKTKEERGKMKKIRNRIYRTCAVIMLGAMAVIYFGGAREIIHEETYNHYKLTFWMEALAVVSFGFSWLIKGETLVKDKIQLNG